LSACRAISSRPERFAGSQPEISGAAGIHHHELKQPLGVLKGYLIMLQDETLGKINTDMQREAILEMRNSVNMLNDMIMKYLQLSKIEAGRLVVEKKRFNLYEEPSSR